MLNVSYLLLQQPLTEATVPLPEDPYGIAKYATELDLKAAHEQFGLDYIIFRPHNVYGEGQNTGDKYRNVIGIFMNQILSGQPMTIFGDGEQTRAFSYIDDVAPVIAYSVKNKAAYSETFNIGGDQPFTVKELAYTLANIMKVEPNIKYLRARNEVMHAISDHNKVYEFFDVTPPISLEDGLTRMMAWVQNIGVRETQEFNGIEITNGLPDGW